MKAKNLKTITVVRDANGCEALYVDAVRKENGDDFIYGACVSDHAAGEAVFVDVMDVEFSIEDDFLNWPDDLTDLFTPKPEAQRP